MATRKQRESVKEYFKSRDPEMRRLGQRLCHRFRINYWVACDANLWKQSPWKATYFKLTKIKVTLFGTKYIYHNKFVHPLFQVHRIILKDGNRKSKKHARKQRS